MSKVLIIAEAGVNHNGSLQIAKEMVNCAVEAGVDVIKFQTFISSNLASRKALKAEYQKNTTGNDESQLAMLRKLELCYEEFEELSTYCNEKRIEFLSTAFDFESIEFLRTLGMKRWKIPSGEITNLPYLIKVGNTSQPVILSTGMASLAEVKCAVEILKKNGCKSLTLLHCTTEYPTPYGDVNLLAMHTLSTEFDLPVGYSDHTAGIEISTAAVAMGAVVIEKHFTLDRNMEGPDHKASLEPHELKAMVDAIRNVETALGNGIKVPAASEMKNIPIARKSIIAKRPISKGEIFTEENLTVKRPGSGVSPMRWFEVVGTASKRDYEEDDLIEL